MRTTGRRRQRSGAEKRRAAKQKRLARRAEWIEENPHPYHRWSIGADRRIAEMAEVMNGRTFEWRRGPSSKGGTLTPLDLAIGRWAVQCEGKNGLSYGQLAFCMAECGGGTCHRNKAAAILRALKDLGQIFHVGGYSTGRHGNRYSLSPEPVQRTVTITRPHVQVVDEDPF